jgi:hypothetical protein
MKPEKRIENLIRKINVTPDAEKDIKTLQDVLEAHKKSQKAANPAVIVNKWKIVQLAAAAAVICVVSLFFITDTNNRQYNETKEAALESKMPSELTTVISLNMAFRNGDMQSLQNQLNEADKKLKHGRENRVTIDQLISELNEYDKI